MKHVVLGTAGHVDHGKTALVKALTGIDTDRLKEEKERGITIDIGFAYLTLPDGQKVGIVDVPGHERFVKNMVAGASGIDFVILVIAADEGVMPQTREHLAICSLLGVRRGLVALTKIDLVDREWLSLVKEDIEEFTRGTFISGAPIIPVSSITKEGMEDLLSALRQCVSTIEEEADAGVFRLPVDRVFTVKGFGTVVTGTVMSGSLSLGDEVVVLPRGVMGKVRGLQSHGAPMEIVRRGQRAAINLQGLDKENVKRGDVVARLGQLVATVRMDTQLTSLASNHREIKNRQIVRLHVGTDEIMARIVLIGRDVLNPGESAYAQFFLERPTVVMAGDRFVIRSYSPITTIGGGKILDPLPRKYKKSAVGYGEELNRLLMGTAEEKVEVILNRGGWGGVQVRELIMRTGMGESRVKAVLERLWSQKEAVVIEDEERRSFSREVFERLQETILREIDAYHQKNPLKAGVPKEELRQLVGAFIPPRLFARALMSLEHSGEIAVERDGVRSTRHRVSLGNLEALRLRLEERYRAAGLTPPTRREILEEHASAKETEAVLEIMLKEGPLIKVSEELYFHREVIDRLREDYRDLLRKEGKATPLSFKEMTGLTRKFIIPLMEYFDAEKLTIRAGEYRILRNKG